ncbi:Transposon Tf2-6 polyprotein [Dictyocoela roeselum]|nr:Transposon Tf2-6 polyprotein [Dictyocoela roeselum]
MPFGLSNATCTFQRAIDSLLGDLNFVKVYLDDILIHSESEDQHLEHIKEVMTRLYNSNVSINYEKSEFLIESVSFLGHTISRKGISPNIDRIEPLRKIKPRNKRQIQRVLGILN